jgi:hypothetical protein
MRKMNADGDDCGAKSTPNAPNANSPFLIYRWASYIGSSPALRAQRLRTIMVTIDSGIVFDVPDTWERFTEGSRCVFHTPRREEIIALASRVTGDGPAAERRQVNERLFQNGLEAAGRGTSTPDLRITKPLAEESGVCSLRCATVLAETMARDAFYGQAVIQHRHGVVFLTYEAPFVEGAEEDFRDLLGRIHDSERAG